MRKINYPTDKKFISKYYDSFFKKNNANKLRNGVEIEDINNSLKRIFINEDYTFEDIITAKLDKLLEINNCIEHYIQNQIKRKILLEYSDFEEKNFINQYFRNRIDQKIKITALREKKNINKRKKIKETIDSSLFKILSFTEMPYEIKSLSEQISGFFMSENKELKIKTCFYCNIDFVNAYADKDGKIKNQYTLDHFLPKGKYPYFSLSFYNLIPSCYTCNSKLKKEKEFTINDNLILLSPSSEKYLFDKNVKFDLRINLENGEVDLNNVMPSLVNISNSKGINDFIELFQLKGRYDFHKDIAQEMVEKRKKYSDSQINEIAKILYISEDQVKRDIFGKELYVESNAPFEKYKFDIGKDLKL